MKISPVKTQLLMSVLLAAGSSEAWACAVCFGDPDSSLSKGVTWGVALLLGVILSVLGVIAYTMFCWAQRAKKLYPPLER